MTSEPQPYVADGSPPAPHRDASRTALTVLLPMLVLVLLGTAPPLMHAVALDNTQTMRQIVGPYHLVQQDDGSWYTAEDGFVEYRAVGRGDDVLDYRVPLSPDDEEHPSQVLALVFVPEEDLPEGPVLKDDRCATWGISVGPHIGTEEAHRTLVRAGEHPDVPLTGDADADRLLRPLCVDQITITLPQGEQLD